MSVTQRNFNLHRTVTHNQALQIGDLSLLTTLVTTDLVSAINSIASAGTVGDLSTITNLPASNPPADVVDALSDVIAALKVTSCGSNLPGAYSSLVCCGDGILEGVETCDDSNQTSGDGCSANCKVSSLTAASLTADQGTIFQGVAGDQVGSVVSCAGDINSDGIADFLVTAQGNDKVYLYLGRKGESFPSGTVSLGSLPADGSDGMIITGAASSGVGFTAKAAGDINHDGVADILIASSAQDSDEYVVFGKRGGLSGTLDLTSLTAADGIILQNDTGDISSTESIVNRAGDVNGDGLQDYMVSYLRLNSNDGAVFLVLGTFFPAASLDLGAGAADATFLGASAENAGVSIEEIEDFNGDGIGDILIASHNANGGTGVVYIILGSKTDLTGTINLSDVGTTIAGMQIQGKTVTSFIGYAASGAGDVNGDGFADVIIGSQADNEVYVVYGSDTPGATLDLNTMTTAQGVTFTDSSTNGFGLQVGCAGDVNKDGFSDLIVSDLFEGMIIFGSNILAALDVGTGLDGDTGFSVITSNAPSSISAGKDLNGDGIDDLILGDSINGDGEAYVVFGHL